jgi:hypothetical protein
MNGGVFLAIFTGLMTLAVIAVILSQNAQTAKVLQALGSATGTAIGAAVAPVTGQSSQTTTAA